MALCSVLEPLAALRRKCRIHFVSDSQYLVKGINEWRHGWKRAGWKRKTGAIANVELWKAVDVAISRHDFSAHWVRGHQGHPENEFADWLATRAAAEQTRSGGLVRSVFDEWLEGQREKGRLLDYTEFEPPEKRYPA
jgi:ribonuclease HI